MILQDLLLQELPAHPVKPERNRAVFGHMVATRFLRYMQVARRVEACYDQMVQPQKRLVLRRLLDAVLGRILELKQELVELDLSEYHYMDHVLQELKLTPVGAGRGCRSRRKGPAWSPRRWLGRAKAPPQGWLSPHLGYLARMTAAQGWKGAAPGLAP